MSSGSTLDRLAPAGGVCVRGIAPSAPSLPGMSPSLGRQAGPPRATGWDEELLDRAGV